MADIEMLDPAAAAAALREAGAAGRGFFGLDPVTQNDALLVRELERLGAQVFRAPGHDAVAVYGCAPNPGQPRQGRIATTGTDPAAVRAFIGFLTTYQRTTSFTATLPAGAPAVAAFTGAGFKQVGTLPEHFYQSGRYQDCLVYYASAEEACHS